MDHDWTTLSVTSIAIVQTPEPHFRVLEPPLYSVVLVVCPNLANATFAGCPTKACITLTIYLLLLIAYACTVAINIRPTRAVNHFFMLLPSCCSGYANQPG